ncbi:aminoacyl-tRNA hydrolase [Candidatus Peregrinibacteria bacterium]|nr:aminoacyl-tRNA hydrolase [Candidatus Peregrinibacteria bacterium]
MKIIVGLGNIGERYKSTRHNIGFMVVDLLAKKFNVKFQNKPKFEAQTAETEFENEKIILAKPTTFMNRSGDAVSKISHFYKITAWDLIIIYDDIDLPLGAIRVKQEGGPGTHNGMKSVVASMGTELIPRLRIGTQSEISKKATTGFVLGAFSAKEKPIIKKSIISATEAALVILEEGIDAAMQRFNTRP